MNLYEILGVARDATADTVKKAFRKLAQQHHPDKGGDHETMQQVQQAYDVLGDAERRARYDETGSTAPVETLLGLARSALADMTNKAIEAIGKQGEDALQYVDLVQIIRDEVNSVRRGNAEKLGQMQRSMRQRKTTLKRLVRKEGDGPNVMGDAAKAGITQLEGEMRAVQEKQTLILKVLDLLAEYDYTIDERAPEPVPEPIPEPQMVSGSRYRPWMF